MDNELNLEIDIFIPHSKNPDVNMRYENIYFFTREGSHGEMDYYCFDASKGTFKRVDSILRFIVGNEISELRKIPERSEKVFLSLAYKILEKTSKEDYERYKTFILVKERRKM